MLFATCPLAIPNPGLLETAQSIATLKAASEGNYTPIQPVQSPPWVTAAILGTMAIFGIAILSGKLNAEPDESEPV